MPGAEHPGHTLAGVTSFTGLAIALAFVALAVGGATGRQAAATGAGAGLAVAGYVANVIGRQSEDWGWLADVSPFGWAFGRFPIMDGWDWQGLSLLAGLAVVACMAGLLVFRNRDVLG